MRKREEEEKRNVKEEEEAEAARRRREERAKEARQKAIEELARKREAKKEETKRLAEEEVKRVGERMENEKNRKRNEAAMMKKRKNSVLSRLATESGNGGGGGGGGGGSGDDDDGNVSSSHGVVNGTDHRDIYDENNSTAVKSFVHDAANAAFAADDAASREMEEEFIGYGSGEGGDVGGGGREAGDGDGPSPVASWVSGSGFIEDPRREPAEEVVNGFDTPASDAKSDSVSVLSTDTRTLGAGPSTVIAGNAALDDLLNSLKTLEADDALDLEKEEEERRKKEAAKRKGPKWLEEIDAIEAAGSGSGTPSVASRRGSGGGRGAAASSAAYLDANNLLRLSQEENNSRPPSSFSRNQSGTNLGSNNKNNNNSSFRGSAGSVSSLLSDAKLQNILDFLTEVEKASTRDKAMVEKQRAEMKAKPLPAAPTVDSNKLLVRTPSPAPMMTTGSSSYRGVNDGAEDGANNIADLEMERHRRAASEATTEVTATVAHLRMEIETKAATIEKLQRSLAQQRELTVRHAKETEREMTHRLHLQKDEYEAAIQRHLSFIDQLIDDKKVGLA